MSLNTDDRRLEDLLRRTMREDAATVRDTPMPTLARPRRATRRGTAWIAGSLAAVAVTALSLTAGTLLGDRRSDSSPSGDARRTCSARPVTPTLDTRLRDASTTLSYDGKQVFAMNTTPNGSIVGEVTNADKSVDVVLVRRDGSGERLLAVPVSRYAIHADADRRFVVVTTGRLLGDTGGPVDRVTLIDTRTGRTTSLLNKVAPSGPHAFLGKFAVIQNDVVYWAAGTHPGATSGSVLAYDIASDSVTTVGHTRTGEVDRDLRGVGWPGGSVRDPHAPAGLPAFFDGSDHFVGVYSDGHTSMWQNRSDRPGIVHVLDEDGIESTWQVSAPGANRDVTPYGVSGHFLFFAGAHDTYVLDLRSGAFADVGVMNINYLSFVNSAGLSVWFDGNPASARVDTGKLPPLIC